MTKINYNSKDIVTWSNYARIKNQTICSIPTDNQKKYLKTDNNLLDIVTLPHTADIANYPNSNVRATYRNLTINDVPAKMFCNVDCNNIGNTILTNNDLSISVLRAARAIPKDIFTLLCCGSDYDESYQQECRQSIGHKVSASKITVENSVDNAMEEYLDFFVTYVGTVIDDT
jgi:hypothetical protein